MPFRISRISAIPSAFLAVSMLLVVACPVFGDEAIDHYERGRTLHDQGDWNGAIAEYTATLTLNPQDADAYASRGITRKANGDLDGAISDYSTAINIRPDQSPCYYNRGLAKSAKGDAAGAIADHTKAIELDPEFTQAYTNRGVARSDRGDVAGAIADFDKAIALRPELPMAYYNRAVAKRKVGDLAGAIADIDVDLRIRPDHAAGYNARALLRYDSRSFTDALSDYRLVIAKNPPGDSAEYAHFRVWVIRARLGETEAATAELRSYLTARKPGKGADWSLSVGRFLSGDLAEREFLAGAAHTDQLTQSEQLCVASFFAGCKRLIAGDSDGARKRFQEAVATKFEFMEYTSAKAELAFIDAQSK